MNAFDFLRTMLAEGVASGVFPSAVCAVGVRDEWRRVYAAGEADAGTRFDMASLTKLLSTAMLSLQAIEEGLLALSDTLPLFYKSVPHDKRGITVEQLLTHTAGFEPTVMLREAISSPCEVERFLLSHPLVAPPDGTPRYSCLGFILLGKIIENVYGTPLDTLARERVFRPLSMNATGYLPQGENIAPTEVDAETGVALRGVVHDENARFLGGVSGNAGVFSDIGDMCRFAQMLATNDGRLLSPATLASATRNRTPGQSAHRGLGFHISGVPGTFMGDLFPKNSFGHTGFTGTSLAIDPWSGFFVVLLTNRVHPTRANERIIRFRRTLHDRAYAALSERCSPPSRML